MKIRFLFLFLGILISSSVVFVITWNNSEDCNEECELEKRRIEAVRPNIGIYEPPVKQTVNFDNVLAMEPDSMELFYYPSPEDGEDRDHFQLFMIIRLPEWLGGNAGDVSAYRVYSTQSVDDQCMVRYWPGDDRQRIENPCRGGFYRAHDGAMTITFGSVPGSPPIALPYLELSSDKNGFLFIEPPTFTTTENGVIGVGRDITPQEILEGSQFYIDAYEKAFPEYPDVPMHFSSMMLAEITPIGSGIKVLYSEFTPTAEYMEIHIAN